MKKYYIEGKEVSALDKAKHKLKQLEEASSLLEEFSDRLAWAEDCSEYPSINEELDSVYTTVEHAKDEIEDQMAQLEEQIQEMFDRKKEVETGVLQEFEQNIQYCLS